MTDSGKQGQKDLRDQRHLERRAFLKQAGIVSLAAAGATWAALAPSHWPLSLKDPDGEEGKPKKRLIRLPEGGYQVPALASAPVLGIARGDGLLVAGEACVYAVGIVGPWIELC